MFTICMHTFESFRSRSYGAYLHPQGRPNANRKRRAFRETTNRLMKRITGNVRRKPMLQMNKSRFAHDGISCGVGAASICGSGLGRNVFGQSGENSTPFPPTRIITHEMVSFVWLLRQIAVFSDNDRLMQSSTLRTSLANRRRPDRSWHDRSG